MLFSIVCKFFLFLLQDSSFFIDINKNIIWQGHPRSSVTVIFFITTSNTRLYKVVRPVLNEIEGVLLMLSKPILNVLFTGH